MVSSPSIFSELIHRQYQAIKALVNNWNGVIFKKKKNNLDLDLDLNLNFKFNKKKKKIDFNFKKEN
jgi:hypothetical protein